MSGPLILQPVLFHLLLSVLMLFLWRQPRYHMGISAVGSALSTLLALALWYRVEASGWVVLQAGQWPAPFGISLVADSFSATLVVLASVAGLAVSLYAGRAIGMARVRFGFFPVFHFLMMGINGAFLTGDIFNLYVWFEILIISSFVLLTLGGEKRQIQGGVKYFTLNVLASVIFLTAIAVLYGLTGALNMADLALKMDALDNRTLVRISGLVFLTGFGIKAALFPLYFWLPASYHTPPSAVSALFAGLLTKVGVYAIYRVFTLLYPEDFFIDSLLLALSVGSIVVGTLGAWREDDLRRTFSWLIIAHIGFILGAFALRDARTLSGGVFYLFHDIIVKTGLFLCAGVILRITGTASIKASGGVMEALPRWSLVLAIPLFALAGIPPLSGFWPKVSLLAGSADQGAWVYAGALLAGSLATLWVTARVWSGVFWKAAPSGMEVKEPLVTAGRDRALLWPVLMLALVSLGMGLFPEPVQSLADRISTGLMDREGYIRAVLPTLSMQ